MGVSRETYDVVVIGGGHAGIEAAAAAARLGARVGLLTGDPARIGLMPCNPAIGGPGKSQLVHELVALGGLMGKLADVSAIHTRVLNRSKGPAVRSLRVQTDRDAYAAAARETIERIPGIRIIRGEATELLLRGDRVSGVLTADGRAFGVAAVVLAAGTFLRGLIWYGLQSRPAGRQGEPPARLLTDAISALGHKTMRLKTGTPPRILARSIDFASLTEVPADDPAGSFTGAPGPHASATPTWITRTQALTHELITANLHVSPLYAGKIDAVGPRYCPSIEDKVVRFADKESHLLFVEPDGLKTSEVYLQGFSSSLPPAVQEKMVRSLPGFARAVVQRYAYAVEYDAFDPRELTPGLMSRHAPGLFLAGQVNGTSGYEEAAVQGLLAGLNAARFAAGSEEVSIRPDQGYIGVLIDDLVTRGVDEPYRMMTSRVALRLLLRGDNADERLVPLAAEWGLRSRADAEKVARKYARVATELARLAGERIDGVTALRWLRRPGATLEEAWQRVGGPMIELSPEETEQVEIRAKYAGYIERQDRLRQRSGELSAYLIPSGLDFRQVHNLSREAVEKLSLRRPASLAEAARIPGLRESEITALLVHIKRTGRGPA